MDFRFDSALPVLQRTPGALKAMLTGLPDEWTTVTEGPGTWSVYDNIGHLIEGDRADWIPRVEHLLRHGDAVPFPRFDREAMFASSKGRTLTQLLDDFAVVRAESLTRLAAINLTDADLARVGQHPKFGTVTLSQLLATWVVHDLGHTAQIARVMAKQYRDAVGPWIEFLPIVTDHPTPRS